MKILKKLFGGADKTDGKKQIERSPRIRLLLSDGVRLETEEGAFPLLNLSESGLGLLDERAVLPARGEGTLYLGGEALRVGFEVVRRNEASAGARFVGDGAALRSALRRLFQEEIRATEMTEVDSAHLSQESAGKPRWFYAPGNYELFFLEEGGRVMRVEIEWGGRVVAASEGEPLRTGSIDEEVRSKPGHARSSLVRWEEAVREEDRSKAIRIVENVPGLDPALRGGVVSLLRT